MKIHLIPLLCACLTMAAATRAHAEPEPEEIETRISVLAIGDAPQPRFVFRDDRRHLLDTPASEHPPGEVLVREKRGGDESFKAVPLGLNSPTGTITYRGERNLILYREDGENGRSEFAKIALPELRDDLTILLLRNRTSKSWDKAPLAHFYDNGFTAFPKDSVRVINLSTVPVIARINEKNSFQLAAGRSSVVRIPREDQGILSYRLAAVLGEEMLLLMDTATTTMPNTRFNLIIYNSDAEGKRMPVDVASYFERPVQEAAE